jgi:1-acyl-sn-glycerol-3-phosphate acyltransferase
MKWIRGYYRLCVTGMTISLGGMLVVLTAWIPLEVKGFRLSFWILVMTVRTMLFFFNVKVACPDPDRFRQHHGFLFPNHVTYLDALVIISVTPARFLAKEEVRSWPVIGLIARAIGCVFVKRENKKSRAEARMALAKVETFPPIVLFPEGKRGPGDELLPFRYGAFEIVTQGSAPFLICAIIYDRLDVTIWRRSEHVIKALWRLATEVGPIHADLIPIETVEPTPASDPVQMSIETREKMADVVNRFYAPEHKPLS